MKRAISIILCFALFLSFSPKINAAEYNYVDVKIDAGDGVIYEKAITKNDDLYFPAELYSEVTRFTYYADQRLFLIDGQSAEKATISVTVNPSENTILISTGKVVKLSSVYEVDGVIYLPMSTMLPALNADVASILDGTIYIANNELSLWELLYNFDIEDYLFDYDSEFAGSALLGLAFTLPNWLLDSITNWRWDRLDVIGCTGDYNDYVDIFTEYLTDDEVYLQAMATEESTTSMWLDIIGTTLDLNENFKTVFEWGEEYEALFETSGEYFDYLEAVMPYPHNLNDLINIVNTEGLSVMDAVEIIKYYSTFCTQVQDHRLMLGAVYDFDLDFWSDSPEHRAAEHVSNLYGNNVADGILVGCSDKLCEELFDIASNIVVRGLKMYELTSKVTGIAMKTVFPHNLMDNAKDISRLSLYERAMQSARSKYYEYSENAGTDEDVNNLRYSILMALLSSRSCYNVMLNTAKGYKDSLLAADYSSQISYYESRINQINAMICLLYKVADNAAYDSYENITDRTKAIQALLKENRTTVLQTGNQIQLTPTEAVENDSNYRYRIDRLDGDRLVVRTQDFSEVVDIGQFDSFKLSNEGFYRSASDNYEKGQSTIYKNHLFYIAQDADYNHGIKRVAPNGTVEFIDCGIDLLATWDATILGGNDNCLYIFLETSLREGENNIIRISNCTENTYGIDTVATMQNTVYKYMDADSIILTANSIFFTAIDDDHDKFLYRMNLSNGEISIAIELPEQYNHLVENDEEIIPIDNQRFIVCLKTNLYSHNAYLYDASTNSLDLLAEDIGTFTSGNSGITYDHLEELVFGYVDNEYFYHLHKDGYQATATVCRTQLTPDGCCHIISTDLPYAFIDVHDSGMHMNYSPDYGDVLSVYGDYILYYSVDEASFNSGVEYTLYYFHTSSTELCGRIKLSQSKLNKLSAAVIDDTLFLLIDGVIFYIDIQQSSIWHKLDYQTDIQDSKSFLHQTGDDIYLVYGSHNEQSIYSSERIDYSRITSSLDEEIDALLSMNSTEISTFIFGPAFEIYNWCRGANSIGENDFNEVVVIDYMPYNRITDGEFIKYDVFKAHVNKYFSQELTDYMLSLGGIVDIDGNIYQFMPGYGGGYAQSTEYYIESYTDNRIVYCERSEYLMGPNDDLQVVNVYFVREKIDGKWVFTEWAQYV